MTRGVIYARYSEGPRQTDQSIEGQVADCRAYADAHGIEVIGIYADRHISGTSTEGRDEFLRMMHDADRRRFDAVIVWKIDRFGRSREDIAVNKIQLRKAGVQLHYAKESVPDGPEGILLESLLEGLAEYYSADLRQKVTRGIRETAKKGRSPFGTLPIGYTTDADRHIVVDPEMAEIVREVFRMHIAGSPVRDIQAMMRKRGASACGKGSVYRILRNEHYLGRFTVQGVDILTDPIIGQSTFDTAAASFRGPYHNAAGRADVDYMLSCKCYCEKCGKMLQGVHGTGKAGQKYYYYRCPSKDIRPIRKEQLEDLVVDTTCREILTDEMIEKLTGKIMEIQHAEQQLDPATALRKELKEVEKKQANIVRALEDGASTSLVARLGELEARADELAVEIERAELQRPMIPEEIIRGWLQSFRSGDKDDPAFRRRLLQTFVADVTVGPEEIVIRYNTTEKGPSRCSDTARRPHLADLYTNTPDIILGRIILRIKREK